MFVSPCSASRTASHPLSRTNLLQKSARCFAAGPSLSSAAQDAGAWVGGGCVLREPRTAWYGTRGIVVVSAGNGEKGEEQEKDEAGEVDWDKAWKQRPISSSRKEVPPPRSEGGFILPDDMPGLDPVQKRMDERTEKLTSIWANPNGYLVGIGLILALILFYSYVFFSGGLDTPRLSGSEITDFME
ncbi:hypothetical protein FVE85_7238 [Porphyridium purpureum]|uniref:Uncharacterized protein n=1 Tax=Porphyridium purpureum TaxID=35688 RepID=A0A5J4ZA73_PORPP|nr:hypothetical protein FVE85_7238 [Porphyridium purpureum]|eukprot:POR5557..scf295_1